MSPALLLLGGGLLVVLVLLWRLFSTPGQADAYDTVERAAMPPELAHARLVYSERTLHADHPVPLVARVDQVYRTREGVLVPVETKRRRWLKVYEADVIELSVQATVLANSPHSRRLGKTVAAFGYVRVARPGHPPRYLRTPLLDARQVSALHQRYFALHAGAEPPRTTESAGLCRQCGQLSRCPRPLAASA